LVYIKPTWARIYLETEGDVDGHTACDHSHTDVYTVITGIYHTYMIGMSVIITTDPVSMNSFNLLSDFTLKFLTIEFLNF